LIRSVRDETVDSMSTFAIVWFHDEDVLGLNESVATAEQTTSERRWPRIKIDARIRVTFSVGLDMMTVDGQGNDVCEGGMAIYLPAERNVGYNVVLELVRRYGTPRTSFSGTVTSP